MLSAYATYKVYVIYHRYIVLMSVCCFPARQKATTNDVNLRKLLGKEDGGFHRYNGSLTTPPCYESVIWTIFHKEISISEKQVILGED